MDASSCSRRAEQSPRTGTSKHSGAPYLDVITISSSQFPQVLRGIDASSPHQSLLVEPIQVPDLAPLGLSRPTPLSPGERPLFYPNGAKSTNFREAIRETLRATESEAERELAEECSSVENETLSPTSSQPRPARPKREKEGGKGSLKSPSSSLSPSKRSSDRFAKEIKNLLSEIHEVNDKMSVLASRG